MKKLVQEQCSTDENEQLVSKGWWGKPDCLPQAKFDFLCVKGSLFSSLEPQKKVEVGKDATQVIIIL